MMKHTFFRYLLGLLIVYNLLVKYRSLWRAARNNHRGWFLLLAFTNTLGILNRSYARRY